VLKGVVKVLVMSLFLGCYPFLHLLLVVDMNNKDPYGTLKFIRNHNFREKTYIGGTIFFRKTIFSYKSDDRCALKSMVAAQLFHFEDNL
jgi:hypothetical protein